MYVCYTLQKPLPEIQTKVMLCTGVILLHDNGDQHIVNRTQDLFYYFLWKQLDNPQYSADLKTHWASALTMIMNSKQL